MNITVTFLLLAFDVFCIMFCFFFFFLFSFLFFSFLYFILFSFLVVWLLCSSSRVTSDTCIPKLRGGVLPIALKEKIARVHSLFVRCVKRDGIHE